MSNLFAASIRSVSCALDPGTISLPSNRDFLSGSFFVLVALIFFVYLTLFAVVAQFFYSLWEYLHLAAWAGPHLCQLNQHVSRGCSTCHGNDPSQAVSIQLGGTNDLVPPH
jgi:hypothetical protein